MVKQENFLEFVRIVDLSGEIRKVDENSRKKREMESR